MKIDIERLINEAKQNRKELFLGIGEEIDDVAFSIYQCPDCHVESVAVNTFIIEISNKQDDNVVGKKQHLFKRIITQNDFWQKEKVVCRCSATTQLSKLVFFSFGMLSKEHYQDCYCYLDSIDDRLLLRSYNIFSGIEVKTGYFLFVDTETTGLPKRYDAPVSDLNNWPRLVQIAWLVYNPEANLISAKNYIIRPDGFVIPDDSSKIHGITNQKARSEGVDLRTVLQEFEDVVIQSEYVIAHNIEFDKKIIGAELFRCSLENYLKRKRGICTMELATEYCAIPGRYGFKWPKLSELHNKLFDTTFEDAHDAAVDIKITAKCFFELKSRGIIYL